MTKSDLPVPNLFLIGAQKGGSTTLSRHLSQHPDIRFFSRKEPNLFSADTVDECKTRLRAAKQKTGDQTYHLDGSVDYTRYPLRAHVPNNIATLCDPQAVKFIYILRNPFDRAVSEYYWKRERYGEYVPIEEALSDTSQYVLTSSYDIQIERFLGTFDRSQFLFVKFDDYYADPNAGFAPVCDFLGLAPIAIDNPDRAWGKTDKVETKEPRFEALNRFLYNNNAVRDVIKAAMPDRMLRRTTAFLSKPVPRQQEPEGMRDRMLSGVFADSIARTETLTGLDLSDWKVAA